MEFIALPKQVAFNKNIKSTTKIVYLTLLSHCHTDNTCFPSLARLAELCNCSIRTVQRHIQILAEEKLITIKRRGSTSNLYTLKCIVKKTLIKVKEVVDRVISKPNKKAQNKPYNNFKRNKDINTQFTVKDEYSHDMIKIRGMLGLANKK